jgi:diguanylate cyclase (GGDEF)-like protein
VPWRCSVQQLSINQGDVAIGKMTLSLGVASYPDQGKTPAELLRSADAALLRAKEQGRDRVLVAQIVAISTA